MERGNQYLKWIDRFVGIPLLWFLSFFKPRGRKIPKTITRIAFIKGAAIGDTVLLSAIIQDIRQVLPEATLSFYCGKTCVDIAKLIPGLNDVVFIPTTQPFKAIRQLRSAGYFDLIIDTGPWTRLEALLCFFTKGAYRIGFRSLDQHRHFCYDQAVVHSDLQHELDNNRNLIRPFISIPYQAPRLSVPNIDKHKLLNRIDTRLAKPFWILHPWSGGFKGHFKEWPANRWIDVAMFLSNQNYVVAFSGAKSNIADTEALVRSCQQRSVDAVNLSGKTSLSELLVIINNAVGVVSVNTGVLHITAALGIPVVGINGPVPSLRWGAASHNAVNIDGIGPDCGYIHLGFEYPASPPDCMGSITSHRVEQAIVSLLTK